MTEQLGQALYVGGGLFWRAFWALAFGYAFSSLIQALVVAQWVILPPLIVWFSRRQIT